MRKSTLFISAVLTTFVMAMLAGVASAYQTVIKDQQVAAQPQPQQQTIAIADSIPAPAPIPVEVQPVNWTPDQAAALAAEVLGRDDLFSVEVVDLNGETVYLVTFSSGDLVYVSFDGQIRLIGKMEVQTVIVNSGGGGGGGKSQPAQSHDNDHEDEHDD